MSPQGEDILLTVPLCKHTDEISYMHRWQHQHWMAIVSAYGKTPYFDYYRPYIEPLYRTQYRTMTELNQHIAYIITSLLRNEPPQSLNSLNPSIPKSLPPLPPTSHFLSALFEHGPATPMSTQVNSSDEVANSSEAYSSNSSCE